MRYTAFEAGIDFLHQSFLIATYCGLPSMPGAGIREDRNDGSYELKILRSLWKQITEVYGDKLQLCMVSRDLCPYARHQTPDRCDWRTNIIVPSESCPLFEINSCGG